MIAILRLILAIFLFLESLLTVFPALSYLLWEASIAADEWGHYLAIVAFFVLLPGWRTPTAKLSSALAAVALLLFLSPLVRAMRVADTLPARLATAFGATKPRSLPGATALDKPISFETLFGKPSSPEVRRMTLPYATREERVLQLDLYRRNGSLQPAPLVIAIHGGSWRTGDRKDLPELNYYLASRGYVVASPSYRFAPEFPHPASSQDIDAAISYLETNASQLGIDPAKIVLLGRSAGAQLALLAAYTRKDSAIKGVVSFYGPTDQKWGWDHPSNPWVYNSAETLHEFLNGDPKTVPEAYRTSSPLNFVSRDSPPTLIIHGTMDPLVSVKQSARLDSALRNVFVPAHLGISSVPGFRDPHLFIELPWATHGCDYVFNGPCGQISTYAIERFVAAVTGGETDRSFKFAAPPH